jgi:hypothetical protein
MTTHTHDAAFIKNAGGRSASVVLLELREKHQALVHKIKVEHKPGSSERLKLLRVADTVAQGPYAAEKKVGGK